VKRGFQLFLLAVAMAVAGYVRTAVSPLQEAMRLALSLTDNQMALLQGPVIGIPVTLAAIPLGLLIDRSSRARLLQLFVLLSLIGSLLTAFSRDFGWLLFARCLAGVMGLGIVPIVFSVLADLYSAAQRGLVTTAVVIGQVVGNSGAFAWGGSLLAMSGPAPDAWRSAMLWLVVPVVPATLLMLALREPPRVGIAIKNPTLKQVWHELRHYRAMIIPLVIGIILAELAVGAILIWASPMLARGYTLPPDQIGNIMAMGSLLSGILGPILGGPLADYCQRTGGPRRTVSVLIVLSLLSIPAGMFAFVPGFAAASTLLVAAMTIILAVALMGMTLFTIVIPNELRGLCMSVLVAAEILFALALGPPIVSLLAGAMGGLAMIGKALSVVCVATAGLTAATFLLGRRHFPHASTQRQARTELSET